MGSRDPITPIRGYIRGSTDRPKFPRIWSVGSPS